MDRLKLALVHALAGATYIKGIWSSVVIDILYLFLQYFIWKQVFGYTDAQNIGGYSFKSFFIYILISKLMTYLISSPPLGFLFSYVRNGDVLFLILNPLRLIEVIFLEHLGKKVIYIFLFLSFCYILSVVEDSVNFGVMTLVSLLLAFLLAFIIDYCFSLTTLFAESQQGIQELKRLSYLALGGALFPISVLPEKFQAALQYSPFAAVYYIPTSLSLGGENHILILFQAFWLLGLFILSLYIESYALRKSVLNGG